MIIVVVCPEGPPWVRIQMMSKLLKVAISDSIDMVMIAGDISGRVMRRNRVQRLAPSVQAASYRSFGIACMAARK